MSDATLAVPVLVPAPRRLLGFLLVLGASFGWSLAGLFTRLLEDTPPLAANGARSLGMSLALTLYLVVRYGRELPARIRRVPLAAHLACGTFFAVGSSLYIVSYSLASVAVVACLGSLSPLFSALLAWLLMRERVGSVVLLALVVAVAGIATMASGEGDFGGAWEGYLSSLFVAFFFAAQIVALRRYRDFDLMPSFALGGFATCLVLLVILSGGAISAHDFWLALGVGVVQLALPLLLFARGARYLPAVLLALFSLMESLLSPLWVFLVVGETPTWETIFGGAMILCAVTLVLLRRG